MDYSARSRYRPPPPLYQRVQKRLAPLLISLGIGPKQVVVLEVPGRRSGLIRRNALVMASHDGNNYLVRAAGESEWVRNVRAADGQVVIGRRQRRTARLVEIPPAERAPGHPGHTCCAGTASRPRLLCSAKFGCSSGSAAIRLSRSYQPSPSSTRYFGSPRCLCPGLDQDAGGTPARHGPFGPCRPVASSQ